MKRKDLNTENLQKAVSDTLQHIKSHVGGIEQFINIGGLLSPQLNQISAEDDDYFISLKQVWNYASLNSSPLQYITGESGVEIDEEIMSIQHFLNSPIWPTSNTTISSDFTDHAIGFCCQVAVARLKLDSYIPLSPDELSLLADRSLTTIQQHCQSKKLTCYKDDAQRWRVKPSEALKYLKEIKAEPFTSSYDIEKFKNK